MHLEHISLERILKAMFKKNILQEKWQPWLVLNITYGIYYRLLTTGTIEEKIFQRQISKTGLSGAVVDLQNQSTIRLSNEELKVHDFPTVESHSLTPCSRISCLLDMKKNMN
jgi:hypothetical protein